jgi:ATP-dependent protease HslVU (ClpYQ) peptidase subunit
MTTIAWDGETLAADRRCTYGGTPTLAAPKLFAVRQPGGEQLLYGLAGKSEWCAMFRRWVESGGKSDKPFAASQDDAGSAICIDGQRRIWLAWERLVWVRQFEKRWAIGTGCDYALGAMAAGATAAQAVRIAATLDTATGNGVQILRFPRQRKRAA